jgi:aminopeptidase N
VGFRQSGDSLVLSVPQNRSLRPDTLLLAINYSGTPVAPSHFGGFYLKDSIAYNLGVLIDGDPPSFGKCWFPCVDNFTDKATYTFDLAVPPGFTGVANGVLTNTQTIGSRTVFSWRLAQPIPTYLAAVAVGRYALIETLYRCEETNNVPISLYVRPQDTIRARASFEKLVCGLQHFESLFGPYGWDRVGYVSVPMRGGAMEHATNIAYPHTAVATGGADYEELWAHELSHSWFGNLVTCHNASQMWLNEGFARYSEALYMEGVYGQEAFRRNLRDLLRRSVLGTHRADGGYQPVVPVPANLTYSSTVYDKGGLMAHALRSYLGDSVFFPALRRYFEAYRYGNATAEQFREALERHGQRPLETFWEGWITTPGWSHFDARIVAVTPEGPGQFRVACRLTQRIVAKPNPVYGTPLPVAFVAPGGQPPHTQAVVFSGYGQEYEVVLPFRPVFAFADPDERFPDAALDELTLVRGPTVREPHGLDLKIEVLACPTPEYIGLRYNLLPPTPGPVPGPQPPVLMERFWTVRHSNSARFKASLRLKVPAPTDAYPSRLVPAQGYQSLKLYYRPEVDGAEWKPVPDAQLVQEGAQWYFTCPHASAGEYAIGYPAQP